MNDWAAKQMDKQVQNWLQEQARSLKATMRKGSDAAIYVDLYEGEEPVKLELRVIEMPGFKRRWWHWSWPGKEQEQ